MLGRLRDCAAYGDGETSMRLLIVGLLMVAASASEASAYTYAGLGTHSCGAWTASRKGSYGTPYQQWVLGYLSAVAAWSPHDSMKHTDSEGVWAWMDRHCWANPTIYVNDAARAFVLEEDQRTRGR